MSLSGMFNTGHDVGGFAGPVPDAELLVRWVQSGALHSALHHELVEGGRRGQHAVAASGGAADRSRLDAPALPPAAVPVYAVLARAPLRRADAAADFLRVRDDPEAFEDSDEFMLGPTCWSHRSSSPARANVMSICPKGPPTGSISGPGALQCGRDGRRGRRRSSAFRCSFPAVPSFRRPTLRTCAASMTSLLVPCASFRGAAAGTAHLRSTKMMARRFVLARESSPSCDCAAGMDVRAPSGFVCADGGRCALPDASVRVVRPAPAKDGRSN